MCYKILKKKFNSSYEVLTFCDMNTEQFGFLKDGTLSIHLKGHLESDVSMGVEETLAINVIDFFI